MTTLRFIMIAMLAGILIGCDDRDSIRVYTTPKEHPAQPRMTSAETPPTTQAAAAPIQWTVPANWKPLPPQPMRFASYQVDDVLCTVVPLGLEAGDVLPNVNRWEGQLGLALTPAADLSKVVRKSTVAGVEISSVDLTAPSGSPPQRMLAAMLQHGGRVWFFKLTGPADKVAAHKGEFDGIIQSLRFESTAP